MTYRWIGKIALFNGLNPHPARWPGRYIMPVLASHYAGTAPGTSALINEKG